MVIKPANVNKHWRVSYITWYTSYACYMSRPHLWPSSGRFNKSL